LPEEWLIERIQQVGANSRKPFSPSFVVVCRTFAAVFCNSRYIFVTATKLSENACLMVKKPVLVAALSQNSLLCAR
jgi:hypothetical protein